MQADDRALRGDHRERRGLELGQQRSPVGGVSFEPELLGSSFRCRRIDVCDTLGNRGSSETTETGVRVAAGAFAEALRQVVSAASRDDARPILTGVLLTASAGGLRLVATDSYRLALRDLEGIEQ